MCRYIFFVALATSLTSSNVFCAEPKPLPITQPPLAPFAQPLDPRELHSPALANESPSLAPQKLPAILQTKPRQPALGDDALKKLLIARHNTAVAEMNATLTAYEADTIGFDAVTDTARRLLVAELELSDKPAEQIATLERSLELVKYVENRIKALYERGSRGGESEKMHRARYLRLDTEIQLLRAKRKHRVGEAVCDPRSS
jgi:hypothetical protein